MSNSYSSQSSHRNSKIKYLSHSSSQIFSNNKSTFHLTGQSIMTSQSNYPKSNNRRKIGSRLKENNILAHKQLNDLNNEYLNMKSFLGDKMNQLEKEQINHFSDIKNILEEQEKKRLREIQYHNNRRRINDEMLWMKNKINEEKEKIRIMDEMRFKKEVDEIERKRAELKMERWKMYDELKNKKKDKDDEESEEN